METIVADIRYGIRGLINHPSFTAIAVVTLALGIGANTAIFTMVNALLLRPMPVAEPERLVSVFGTEQKNRGHAFNFDPISYPNFNDYRSHNQSFSDLVAHQQVEMSLSTNSEPQQITGEIVTGNYFDMLGVKAGAGRTFLPEEDRIPGAHPVTVLSHALWQTRFGGDRSLIGKTVKLNNLSYSVIGIAPEVFRGTNLIAPSDLWVPMMMHDQVLTGVFRRLFNERRGLLMNVTGRLKPGVTIGQAESEMKSIAGSLEEQYPHENEKRSISLMPLSQSAINPDLRDVFVRSGALLMSVAGLVLLIASANVANLMLVRASARRREVAVRLALGAGRGRLMRQLLTESLLLALLGGGLGVLIAVFGRDALWSFRPPILQPASIDISLNPQVLGVALLLTLLTALIFGLAPAIRASRTELASELKDRGAQTTRDHHRFSLRHALVVTQVALSLVALIGAGLFLRSLRHAQQINPGFETRAMMILSFNLGLLGYTEAQGQEFYRRAEERVETIPGVRMAAVSAKAPFAAGFQRSVTPEGETLLAGSSGTLTTTNSVEVKYFDALGVSLISGRKFTDMDVEGVTPVAIINEAAAERFWPGQNVIGKRFRFFGDSFLREIIGLVRNTVEVNLGEAPVPMIFLPMRQSYASAVTLFVRTQSDPGSLLNVVRREVHGLDQSLSIVRVQMMSDVLGQGLWAPRMAAALLSIFGLLALLLAAVGLYGVLAFSVNQRTQEIGIRLALGATHRDILKLAVGQGLVLTLIGVGIGVVASLGLTRFVSSLLFEVTATDPLTFALVAALLTTVALLACYVPARRATKVDPLVALRYE